MNWFYDLKVKYKLIISFIVVSVFAAAVGIVSVTNMHAASNGDTFLYKDNAKALGAIGQFGIDAELMRSEMRDVALSSTMEELNGHIEKLGAEKDTLRREMRIYQSTLSSQADRDNYAKLEAAENDMFGKVDQFIGLEEAGKKAAALAYFKGTVKTSGTTLDNAIGETMRLTMNEARSAYDANTALFGSGETMMIVFGIAAVVVAILLGLFVSGYLSDNIGKVAARVEQLQSVCITNLGNGLLAMAGGDLSAKVEKATKPLDMKQKDDIGMMAASVDQMIIKSQAGIDQYENVRDRINDLISETDRLIQDSKNGLLNNRGDVSRFNGTYKNIVQGINDMLDAVILPVKEGADVLAEMAKGDLTVRVEGDYKGDHQLIKNSINQLGDSLTEVLAEVSEAIQGTAGASTQISSSTEEMAAGAQEQSAQAAEVATAVEEMTKTIIETTRNAAAAADSAKGAGRTAEDGGSVVKGTIAGMDRVAEVVGRSSEKIKMLGRSSDQIGEIIQVIDDIADQTNLLALNAAIEAARAGEQGRGFAVVADEVRKLAERTTKATKEIAEMIKKIQVETGEVVDAIDEGTAEVQNGKKMADEASVALGQIITGARDVVDMITQVASASEEQSTAAEQISKNIEAISTVSQQSAMGTQQIARAADDLNRLTSSLQDLIAKFTIGRRRTSSSPEVGVSDYGSKLSVRANGELVNS